MTHTLTLKKVVNTYTFDVARSTTARNELNPPLITAGPIVETVNIALSVKKNINQLGDGFVALICKNKTSRIKSI